MDLKKLNSLVQEQTNQNGTTVAIVNNCVGKHSNWKQHLLVQKELPEELKFSRDKTTQNCTVLVFT